MSDRELDRLRALESAVEATGDRVVNVRGQLVELGRNDEHPFATILVEGRRFVLPLRMVDAHRLGPLLFGEVLIAIVGRPPTADGILRDDIPF